MFSARPKLERRMRVASARKQCPVRSVLTESKCKRPRRKENCAVSVRRRMRRGCGGFAKMLLSVENGLDTCHLLVLTQGDTTKNTNTCHRVISWLWSNIHSEPNRPFSLRRGVLVLFQSRSLELLQHRHHHHLRPSTSSTSALLSATFSLLL